MKTFKPILCYKCCKDVHLSEYIYTNATQKIQCTICRKKHEAINVKEDINLTNLFRALIRYYYSEVRYNIHMGGETIETLFYSENSIIEHKYKDIDEECDFDFEELIASLIGESEDKQDVSIYRGFYKKYQLLYTTALKDETHTILSRLDSELNIHKYTEYKSKIKKVITRLFKSGEVVKEELNFHSLYRARIGYEEELYFEPEDEPHVPQIKVKAAYSDEDISAPPSKLAKAGRLNRAGVSALYLASDIETAFAEVRPHPGHYVSIGQFKKHTTAKIKVVDLRKVDFLKYYENDKKLEDYTILNDLARRLKLPVLPEETGGYLTTQFVADVLAELKFDGILYSSAVAKGYNIAIFNPALFEYVENSSSLYYMQRLSFDYDKIEIEDNEEWGFPEERKEAVNYENKPETFNTAKIDFAN